MSPTRFPQDCGSARASAWFYVLMFPFYNLFTSASCGPLFLQERKRLETILSLCSELGSLESVCPKHSPGVCAISELQKINHELEKLQLSDDESTFSDLFIIAAPEDGLVVKGTGERKLQTTTIMQSSVSSPSPHMDSNIILKQVSFRVCVSTLEQ